MAYQGYPQPPPQVMVVQQPTSSTPYPQNIKRWDTEMCGCCDDMGVCCCGFFCLPCLTCCVAKGLDEQCWCCLPYVCCHPAFTLTAMRVKIRTMLGIQGSICGDACNVIWCTPCVTCQMARQLKSVGMY